MSASRLTSAAEIVKAFVAHNEVGRDELPGLIRDVCASLSGVSAEPVRAVVARSPPAVPIGQSVTPDYIVSLENGRRYKTLKRHLEALGLTPLQYRAKWGLPLDYPMIARNYTRQRSDFAKVVWSSRSAAGRSPRLGQDGEAPPTVPPGLPPARRSERSGAKH